ncbi:protein of unknown function [Clostridium amylolyticum]|uniref:DUF4349 domain-containing protein n=1 Tax=Clostridium amylolyticum TaxID=1121298 RepID=A0A1M6MRC7_9CLOT|nr:DUF4349 domain-containing protein [Clostridium amylolyticum]SHJ86068.1 protein of unknown function [Clostridium amylolyticum]
MNKKIRIVASLLFLLFIFSACSKKSDASPGAAKNSSMDKSKQELSIKDGSVASTENKNAENSKEKPLQDSARKVIKRASLTVETVGYDETLNGIANLSETMGGYIENSDLMGKGYGNTNFQSRRAHFTIRVPKKNFDEFLNKISTISNILQKQVNGEDITSQYIDTEARLKTLNVREERVLELLKKATKLEDVLQLEKELSNIRYEIENLTGSLKKMDNLVELTTVNIEVIEVSQITKVEGMPKSIWQKTALVFKQSLNSLGTILQGLYLFIIGLIPYLVIIIPIGFIVYKVYRKKSKK